MRRENGRVWLIPHDAAHQPNPRRRRRYPRHGSRRPARAPTRAPRAAHGTFSLGTASPCTSRQNVGTYQPNDRTPT
ncbi:hypothetical protein [Nocardia sp. NPDC058666]|uniref:hypothetical protein n=1 Tax=Nocardia sp. NPDC058666 TaxID=3346587 RepID=UPI003650CBEE